MKQSGLRHIIILLFLVITTTASAPVKNRFSAAEQQQVSIETPGLFSHSDAFNVDFASVRDDEYSFPLPVGKAKQLDNNTLEIDTKAGDAVKAMFAGTVRLSRKHNELGNVIVVRHRNGLETVYSGNAQNRVEVGQEVVAGQTIAIVGESDGRAFSTFSIMVNGCRINPSTIIDIKNHRLRRHILLCKKNGKLVDVSTDGADQPDFVTADFNEDPFAETSTLKLDLTEMDDTKWAFPLPGAKVISPYGGKRRHAGVDLKTKPNDKIVAAFDGVVTRSSPYYGYGNCIVIKHSYGLETLYSHQSKNLVKVGDKVKAGQVIGLTGRTGRATTEHLHFEVSFKGRRMNPTTIFDCTKRTLQPSILTLNKNGKVAAKKTTSGTAK